MTAHPKPKVVKDPKYLAFVRQMPCWARGRQGSQCGHTIGNGPSECSHLDTKSRDDRVLPMCGGHHRVFRVSWHNGQETFCEVYGVTKAQLIREAEQLYTAYKGE